MRIAVFADIHGNFDALDAVLADMEDHDPDQLVCLGDIVGYGAEPSACLAALRPLECITVAGNHDLAAAGVSDIWHFNEYARAAVLWTQDAISRFDADYLSALPFVVSEADFAVTHGTFDHPQRFLYLEGAASAQQSFSNFSTRAGFVAHTHCPAAYVLKSADDFPERVETGEIRLEEGHRAILNVGSVGQPRNEDPRACWVMYDTDDGSIKYHRTPYDVESAANKIRAANLPEILAIRLEIGR